MWDLSSLTRDQTCTPCNGRPSLNHWTSREVTGKVIFQRVRTELTEKCHDGCCHCCAIAKSHLVWDTTAPAPGDRWGEHKRPWDAVKDSIVSFERMEAPNFKVKLNWRSGPYLLLLLLSCFSHVRLCATPETAARQVPHPWDSPGKNTGVGRYFLLQDHTYMTAKKPVITFDPTENLRIAYEACLNRIRWRSSNNGTFQCRRWV